VDQTAAIEPCRREYTRGGGKWPLPAFDTIGIRSAASLCRYLDALERDLLPKTIVYNLNPADNYAIGRAIGSFQDGFTRWKIQSAAPGGSGSERRHRIAAEWRSPHGFLLARLHRHGDGIPDPSCRFRRHEYFRRVLCNLIGQEMENGELPRDEACLGLWCRNLCFENAGKYLDLPVLKNPTGSPSETVFHLAHRSG